MKKRTLLCNFIYFLYIFSLFFAVFAVFLTSNININNLSAFATNAENGGLEIIDLSTSTSDIVISDTSKHYKLQKQNSSINVVIKNTLSMECDFYITLDNIELSGTFQMPTVTIIDNGFGTNVFFYLEGTNKITANSSHGVFAISTTGETSNLAKVNVVFATETSGNLELKNTFGSAPVLSMQENIQTLFKINTNKSTTSKFLINGTELEFDEDFEKCALAGNMVTKLSLESKENKKHTVRFNTMGYGNIDSILIDSGSSSINLPTPTAEDLQFFAWYKDNLLTQKWTNSDTVTEDITLYAGWIKPQEESQTADSTKIVLYIVIGTIALLSVVFVIIFLIAYKKGKIKSSFLDKLFKTKIKNLK